VNLTKSILAVAVSTIYSTGCFAQTGIVTTDDGIISVQDGKTLSDKGFDRTTVHLRPASQSKNNRYTGASNLYVESIYNDDMDPISPSRSTDDIFINSNQILNGGESYRGIFYGASTQSVNFGVSEGEGFFDQSIQNIERGGVSNNAVFSQRSKQIAGTEADINFPVFLDHSELHASIKSNIQSPQFWGNSRGFIDAGARLYGFTTLKDSSQLTVITSPAGSEYLDDALRADDIEINDKSALILKPGTSSLENGISKIKNITLNNGSIIFLHEIGSSFSTLKTDMLSGTGGTLRMNGNLAGNNDVLDTKDMSGSGVYTVQLNNADSGAELDPKGHELLKIGRLEPGANPEFKFSNGEVDQGVHKAEVKTIKTPDGLSVVVAPNFSKTSHSTDAVMGLASASQYVFDGEMQALRTRHGDVQQGNGGVWARYLHNSTDITAGAGAAFSLGQNGMEVGADKVFALADGKLSIGALTSYSKSSVNQRDENSHVRSMGAGLYSTYVSSAGYYVDGVVKFNHFNNDLRTRTDQGQHVKGSYSQNGIGASLEAGYKYALGYGLNLDPYVRTTYFAAKGKDITLSNGLKADIGTQQSAKGELGVSVGKTFQLDHVALSPYVTVAVEHEFLKDNKVTFNDRYTYKNDQSGTLGKYGAGLTAQLAKNTQAYAEVDYRKGDKVESPIMANIGVRVNF